MQFTLLQMIATGGCILIMGLAMGRFLRKSVGDGFFTRIFKDGKDFDQTLDRVGIIAILIIMIISFHDELKNPATAATVVILIQGAFNLYGQITIGKSIKDMSNGNSGNIKVVDPSEKVEVAA